VNGADGAAALQRDVPVRPSTMSSISALRAMSSRLMRLKATLNSCSACDRAGSTIFAQELGGDGLRVNLLDRSGGAQNVVGGDPRPLASEFVTAAGSADAAQNPLADQRLQDGLKVARRQTMARRESFCRYGTTLRV
jgi:hypothetical protein